MDNQLTVHEAHRFSYLSEIEASLVLPQPTLLAFRLE